MNFRPDRARQMTVALTDSAFNEFELNLPAIQVTTLTQYASSLSAGGFCTANAKRHPGRVDGQARQTQLRLPD